MIRLSSFIAFALALGTSAIAAETVRSRPAARPQPADRFDAARASLSWEIALAPHSGNGKTDEQIIKAQQAVRAATDPSQQLERLGWLYVAKARESFDPGFYKLAEQCAFALQTSDAKSPAALLLLGHVAQSLHRFKDAETIARQLVAQREIPFDHGLLGDALVDQGRVREAAAEYQRMLELRPSLQSYSRVSHVRWLTGDLTGAIDAARQATRAANPRDAESAAWVFTRLGTLKFQAGAASLAESACKAALEFVADFPPALLLRGRLLLADGKFVEAIEPLRLAAAKNPLPEYQWTLADALRSANRAEEAEAVETELKRTGAAADPRTFALFLATRGDQVDVALRLGTRELQERADVFTHDALAWAQSANGLEAHAWKSIERALAEGTQDARLFLHAAVIAARLARPDTSERLERARTLAHLLLPSEREHLARVAQSANEPLALAPR